jgi:DNA-nicking Smr family endonuclease
MSNKGRPPQDAELSLWERFVQGINPLHKKMQNLIPEQPIKQKIIAKSDINIPKPEGIQPIRKQKSEIDGNTFEKLRKGKIPVEAILDLHGMTQAQAHQNLIGFVTRAFQSQKRCVLVITGKGNRNPGEVGILKSRLPDWLNIPPLENMVLSHTQSKQKHGGSGAFYLYLKKPKP